MKAIDAEQFHKLFGARKPRINYQKHDFLDYALMVLCSAGVIYACYGRSPLAVLGIALCAVMLVGFTVRHGVELGVPAIARRPQDIVFMVVHKLQNIKPIYFVALGVLLLENYLVYLTPSLPHHIELMHKIALFAFYLHFIGISVYRTVILIDHLRKQALVREVLMQSSWRSFLSNQPSVTLEIVHAYCTGLLTHIVLLAPWYVVIAYSKFSIVFAPFVLAANIVTHMKFLKVVNSWFYRDHWLGHNSELDFLYLHGPHHDAIPSGLIGVAGNGYLEGFFRNVLAYPTPFYNPVAACLFYTLEVQRDIAFHQYIPGIFPKMDREFREVCQHSTHHFGRLEPYGFAIKIDQPGFSEEFKEVFRKLPEEFSNSILLDEQLTGFEWDNPRHRWYLDLCNKYEKPAPDADADVGTAKQHG